MSRIPRSVSKVFVILLILATSMLSGGDVNVPSDAAPSPQGHMWFNGYVRRGPATTIGIPGVTVQLWCYAPPWINSWNLVDTTVTDANGRFTFTDVSSVTHSLYVNAPGYASRTLDLSPGTHSPTVLLDPAM